MYLPRTSNLEALFQCYSALFLVSEENLKFGSALFHMIFQWSLFPNIPQAWKRHCSIRVSIVPCFVTCLPGASELSSHCYHLGGCQNYDPFLGTLNIRCHIMIGTQKGTNILTTTHLILQNSVLRNLPT